ncbi:reverse transcriptase domain-containing protein [Tanacetum coccineum]
MRTRSQSREQRPPPEEPPVIIEPLRIEYPFQEDPHVEPMADTRTMAQLLQAPTEGYEDAILIPEIVANNFELRHGLINLVQNKQFFGHDKEDPHAHIRYFNKITSTMRVPNVPIATIKLMLFPFSIEGAARIWLEKEPPRSIQTWDDLVSKFINQFFPPSKTTNLRNEITRFQQRFDESFYEAWDRFNDLLRACPHHGFSELHQLDTFYNALNINDQDSLNSAAAKAVVAKVSTNSSTQAVSSDVAELKDIVRALLLDKKNQASAPAPAPAPVKAVELSCVTCGGAHSHQNCPATHGNVYRDNISEVRTLLEHRLLTPKEKIRRRDREDLKGITTRSGVAYQGPPIPTSSVVKPIPEVTKDQVHPSCSQSTAPVQPPVGPEPITTPAFEPIVAPVVAPVPNTKPSVSLLSFTDALVLMPKFASTLRTLLGNKEKLTEVARHFPGNGAKN